MDKTNFKFIRLDSPDKFKDYWFKPTKSLIKNYHRNIWNKVWWE